MGSRFKDDTKDPAVNVTTWIFMVIIVIVVATRLGMKFYLFKRLMIDDTLITASLLFAIAQGLTTSLAVAEGYGYHYAAVNNFRLNKIMKSLYAGSLFHILSLTCSKLSLALFIRDLTPTARDRRLAIIVETTIGTWAVVAFFGTAFECSVPRTWDLWNGKCFGLVSNSSLLLCITIALFSWARAKTTLMATAVLPQLAWRYFIAGSNISTDLLLVVQAGFLLSAIQATAKRRIMFAAIFLPRISVPTAVIVQLTVIKTGMQSADPTFHLCETTIIEGVVQCLSIVTACWGQLKPFLSWMHSNGLKVTSWDDTTTLFCAESRIRKTERDSGAAEGGLSARKNCNRIIVTQGWDVSSHSSLANTVFESEDWGYHCHGASATYFYAPSMDCC